MAQTPHLREPLPC